MKTKYGACDDYSNIQGEAQSLLTSVCREKKDMLLKLVGILLGILQDSDTDNVTPSKKDGALYMIGLIAESLLETKSYKDKMEQFLVSLVFSQFSSSHGHLRARACWMISQFSEVEFQIFDFTKCFEIISIFNH